MFGIRVFLFGTLVGTCSGLFVANYHVVNTPQGLVVVPRTQRPPLRSSYVDIRSWSAAMWGNHPEVTQALIADGRSALIGENLKDNLLDEIISDEIIPEQTQTGRPRRSRNVARQTEIPNRFEASPSVKAEPDLFAFQTSLKANEPARLLDQRSPVRKRWEAAVDEAIAPIVEEDPEDLVSDSPGEGLASSDEMVRKMEQRLGGLLDDTSATSSGVNSSRTEAIPTSREAKEMARDLLQQVIPPGGSLQRSATPQRDFGQDLLSAPAPGQGGTAPIRSRVPED